MKKNIFLTDRAKAPRIPSAQFFRLLSGLRQAVLFSCFVLVLYSSCKKDGGGTDWRGPMIKTETTNNSTIAYWYDKKGRIVKLENGDWVRTEFIYSQDSIHFKSTELATGAVEKYAGYLNASGKVLSLEGTEYVYDASDRLSETYLPIQSNGWQVRKKNYYSSTTGALDSVRQTESRLLQTRWLQTTIYTYYTTLAETHGIENFGSGFWGKNDLHPLKHSETWSPMAAAPFRQITYTTDRSYGYDDAGRIVVQDHREVRPDNSIAQWRTVYTYY